MEHHHQLRVVGISIPFANLSRFHQRGAARELALAPSPTHTPTSRTTTAFVYLQGIHSNPRPFYPGLIRVVGVVSSAVTRASLLSAPIEAAAADRRDVDGHPGLGRLQLHATRTPTATCMTTRADREAQDQCAVLDYLLPAASPRVSRAMNWIGGSAQVARDRVARGSVATDSVPRARSRCNTAHDPRRAQSHCAAGRH